MIKESKEKEVLEKIVQLEQDIFKGTAFSLEQLLEMSEIERYRFITINYNNETAGYVILLDSIDVWEIMKIGTAEKYRRKGLGDELLKYIFSFVQMPVMLEVREHNLGAIEFYRKNGFEKIGIRKNYYHDTGEAAVIMIKDICGDSVPHTPA